MLLSILSLPLSLHRTCTTHTHHTHWCVQRMEDVDHAPQSLPTGGGRGTSEREKQLVEENSKLQARLSILAKVGRAQTCTWGKTGAVVVRPFVSLRLCTKAWLCPLNSFLCFKRYIHGDALVVLMEHGTPHKHTTHTVTSLVHYSLSLSRVMKRS